MQCIVLVGTSTVYVRCRDVTGIAMAHENMAKPSNFFSKKLGCVRTFFVSLGNGRMNIIRKLGKRGQCVECGGSRQITDGKRG